MIHAGSCHCGAVQFRVTAQIDDLTTCDCSVCVKKNAVMARVPETALEIVDGADNLTLYEWNTRQAKHFFCKTCGIYVFHRKRAQPDHFGINVFCLDGFDPAAVSVRRTQGADMSVVNAKARTEWPGPRL